MPTLVTSLELMEARTLVSIVVQKMVDHGVLMLPLGEEQAEKLAAAYVDAVQTIGEKFAQEAPF